MIKDRTAFIRAETRLLPVPHTPEISLYVADEATALWQKTEEELGTLGLPPPFWAFAWAGGQALARYVLDHPETVRGGACWISPPARASSDRRHESRRGARNSLRHRRLRDCGDRPQCRGQRRVALTPFRDNLVGQDLGWDTVLAGDICYERDLAQAVTDWLFALQRRGATVLSAIRAGAICQGTASIISPEYAVPVTRTLEDADVKKTSVWGFARI